MKVNGQRQSKEKSGKDKFRELDVQIQNVEMASRISQMMLKQVLEQFQGLRRDVDNSMGILNDFQYRTLAMLELGGFDKVELDKLAEKYKLVDYSKASDQEDAIKGYLNDDAGTVAENSIVIITSTTDGNEDKGIFRSKFNMDECRTETLRTKLLGSKVGDIIDEEINGENHTITILGLRKIKEGEKVGEEDKSN